MLIHRLGLFSTEQDFVLFMAQVDPLFSNKVSTSNQIHPFVYGYFIFILGFFKCARREVLFRYY